MLYVRKERGIKRELPASFTIIYHLEPYSKNIFVHKTPAICHLLCKQTAMPQIHAIHQMFL